MILRIRIFVNRKILILSFFKKNDNSKKTSKNKINSKNKNLCEYRPRSPHQSCKVKSLLDLVKVFVHLSIINMNS